MNNTTKTFMGIPLEEFSDTDSYVAKRLINGDRRHCSYPQNGIPKTKVEKGLAPTAANIFGFGVEKNKS